jgi:hypothetical protein
MTIKIKFNKTIKKATNHNPKIYKRVELIIPIKPKIKITRKMKKLKNPNKIKYYYLHL